MVQCNIENFNKICSSIKVTKSNSVDVKKIPVLQHKTHDGSVPGFSSSLVTLAKTNNKQLLGNTLEEQALVRQWMDYAASSANYVDVPHVSKQILKDVNATLADRTYIAGNFKSLADIVLYHLLFKTVSNFTFQEKEQFVHLSRWYNNLQQDNNIRGSNASVTFSRTLLY
ncbi:eukaryotic translation elongation factor 1 epsilon-1 [Thrips palmi]|uniref:Eukaryotic translation elongation factor 1 epsilon-1 n=1 Tax=Thrips palmi TaxID=161013 RepID=A0A6P8YPA1_THRPL|nr:eukaryotic translation elongation factor 1 epsilon-1 [Thrips palmi]